MSRDGKSGKHLLLNPAFAQYTPTPEQKRRMKFFAHFCSEVRS